jgi:hypothetical protein
LDSQKVAVPAAVLEHRQNAAVALRNPNQLLPFCTRHGERLVHHHVEPRLQRRLRQRVVRRRRRSEDHKIKVSRERQDSVAVGHGFHARITLDGGGLAGGVRRRDDVQRVSGIGRDQRGVKDASGEAITDDGGPDGRAFNGGLLSGGGKRR